MPAPPNPVRADFDRIARLPDDGWDHNAHYHDYLLRHAPARCRAALDVGSGTGSFSRRLARRADRVLGLDLSPEMVRVARARSAGYVNLEYRVADLMTEPLPAASFDCVASLATLHHVLLAPALERLAGALAPGGVLLALDLYRIDGPVDAAWAAVALPVSWALDRAYCGRRGRSAESRAAWAEHGRHDRYLALAEIRRVARRVLPGARVRRHLLWRYSLLWRKPAPRPSPV